MVGGDSALVQATLSPETGWTSVRVYFKRGGETTEHFIEMVSGGEGEFWAVLPRPAAATAAVVCRIVARNESGEEAAAAPVTVPVSADCLVGLTGDQRRAAANLVIGDTALDQRGKMIPGFLCDGIVSRLGADGKMRIDEGCREAAIAAAGGGAPGSVAVPAILVGVAAGGVAVVSHDKKSEASPAKP
jgi:hypothetical protein